MRRPTPSHRSAATVATAALALALAGCSGTDVPPGPTTPAPLPEPGPITQLSDEIFGSLEPGSWDSDAVRIEELAAQCMAEEGFTYAPVNPDGGPEMVEPQWDAEPDTREWAELYGYGLSTDAFQWDAQYRAWWDDGGPDQDPDPNAEYVSGMSASEQQAYAIALWGEPSADNPEPDWETGGCQGWARHQVEQEMAGQDTWRGAAGFEILSDANGQVWDSTFADPRFAELDNRWASCIADAGYPDFSRPEEAANWVLNQVNEAQPDPGLTADSTSADRHAAWDRIDARMAEIRPAEIELAVADFDCKVEIAYPHTLIEISAEYEQEIYDANRADFEALRDAFREWQANR